MEFIREFWLVWLMALFIGIVVYAYWPGNKRRMERHGRIPFKDDTARGHDDKNGHTPGTGKGS